MRLELCVRGLWIVENEVEIASQQLLNPTHSNTFLWLKYLCCHIRTTLKIHNVQNHGMYQKVGNIGHDAAYCLPLPEQVRGLTSPIAELPQHQSYGRAVHDNAIWVLIAERDRLYWLVHIDIRGCAFTIDTVN
jgi:hypothetical protein